MRFMVIVKASKESEAGVLPSAELLEKMGKYNEELVKAGVMLAGEGLHASSKGARVKFSGNQRTVTDGPFAQTKELIAGFWLSQLKSKEEAIEWLKRAPFDGDTEVEIRQLLRRKISHRATRRENSGPPRNACVHRRHACRCQNVQKQRVFPWVRTTVGTLCSVV